MKSSVVVEEEEEEIKEFILRKDLERKDLEMEAKLIEFNNSQDQLSNLALDIGGSLIKMVYFSSTTTVGQTKDTSDYHRVGRLHFLMFETTKISKCIDFISSNNLQNHGNQDGEAPGYGKNIIKATGGGAYKFADLFKDKLGISLDKVDEMSSLVAGANFLLKAVQNEAFTYMDGQEEFVQIDQSDLYPYLLVNIGSGVSMIKVDSDDKFERVSGTSVGGGTFWGMGKLLTKCQSFDDLLKLSHKGNNRVIDMLVGDIYGGMDYPKIGLTSTAIASSFGKAVSEDKDLEDYNPEDLARSLLRMISNNTAQIAYLTAKLSGIKRIFFGGFFIRGHAYTMDTISVGVHFWSKGEAKALFLRHEGFLGALGSYLSYNEGVTGRVTEHVCSSKSLPLCSTTGSDSSTQVDVKHSGCIECTLHVSS